jgi:transcriptional regulator with XRE-family HTH domain
MSDNQLQNNSQKIEKLKKVIKRSNLKNATALARALKLKPGYISEILNGKKMVPKTMGQKLEDELQVNRKWFDFIYEESDSRQEPTMYLYNSNHDILPQLDSIIEDIKDVDLRVLSNKVGIPEDRLYLFSIQQKTPTVDEYKLLVDHLEKEYLLNRT